MTDKTETRQPRAALIVGSIGAFVFGVAGLIVGFTEPQAGRTRCGSVLGGGDDLTADRIAACEWALSTVNTWTWLLFVAAGAFLVVGLILNAIRRLEQAR